jgi:hypothetical protein
LALIARSTGWTFAEVRAMRIDDYFALMESYSEYPPEHVMIGTFLGYKARDGR